jgi:hypothetical protein
MLENFAPTLRGESRAAAAWPAMLLAGLLMSAGAALAAPPSRGSLFAVGVVLLGVAVQMLSIRRRAQSWRAATIASHAPHDRRSTCNDVPRPRAAPLAALDTAPGSA